VSYFGLLTQQCTYWPVESPDGVNQPAGLPVPLLCRWQDKLERMIDAAGREYVCRAVLYCPEALMLDGWIARGTYTFADPVDAGAFRVRTCERSQDPANSIVVWKVGAG